MPGTFPRLTDAGRIESREGHKLSDEPNTPDVGTRSRTIFQTDEPRPRGFLAGASYDLTALVQTTVALLRAGLLRAIVVMLALALVAMLLPVLLVVHVCLAFPGIVVVGPLLVAGPLVVFSRLALGERLTIRQAIGAALGSLPALIVNQLALAAAATCVVCLNLCAAFLLQDSRFGGAVVTFLLTLAMSLGILAALAEIILEAVVQTAIADPHERKAELNAIMGRCRGRRLMLLFSTAVPVMIVCASSPTPFARELVAQLFGSEGVMVFMTCIALAGVTLAILLGSALLAASYAVILGSPLEGSPQAPPSS